MITWVPSHLVSEAKDAWSFGSFLGEMSDLEPYKPQYLGVKLLWD